MDYSKEDGTRYNRENSKGKSVSDFLVIVIKKFDHWVCKFYQTVLIRKLLESTVMEHCNGLPTPPKVEAPIGTDENGPGLRKIVPNHLLIYSG